MRNLNVLIGAACAALASAPVASAALVLEEYFAQATASQDAVVGWSDGTNNVQFNTANMDFVNPSYLAPGNTGTGRLVGSGSATPRGIQKTLSVTPLAGELWVSFLVRPTATPGVQSVLGFGLNSASYSNASPNGDMLGLGYDGSTGHAAVWRNHSAATRTYGTDNSFTAGTADSNIYLIVAKLNIDSTPGADNDSASVWAIKAGDTFGGTEASLGAADLTTSAADWGTGVTNIWVGRADAVIGWNMDSFRVSTASGNAGLQEVLGIPEPGGLALLGAAGLLALRRRQR